jgi:hypothetical protein
VSLFQADRRVLEPGAVVMSLISRQKLPIAQKLAGL